jgi:GAF domain-containing protein
MHVVDRGAPLAIRDAREDPLVRDNLAVPDLGVVAYLGAPLTLADGHVAGALCVIDHRPRHWTADQVAVIADLAASVVTELELERRP